MVAAAGAALVQGFSGHWDAKPLLLAMGALAGEASFSLLAVPLLPRLGPLALSTYVSAVAAVILAVSAALIERRLVSPHADQAIALAYMAVVVTVVAFVAWYWALGRLGAGRAGLFAGIVPVSATAASVLVGTSAFSAAKLIGACLVALAVIVGMSAGRGGPEASVGGA